MFLVPCIRLFGISCVGVSSCLDVVIVFFSKEMVEQDNQRRFWLVFGQKINLLKIRLVDIICVSIWFLWSMKHIFLIWLIVFVVSVCWLEHTV